MLAAKTNKRKHAAASTSHAANDNNVNEEDEVDPELAAEMQAVKMMREEHSKRASHGSGNGITMNKDALLHCIAKADTRALPFSQTLQVCDVDLVVNDEHDDLDREVGRYICVCIYVCMCVCVYICVCRG